MLRAPFPLHTCHRQYPGAAIAGTTLLFSRNDLSLPRIDWQVGPHITLFEACSAFTHVAACILAKSPSDPLHRRLQPLRYLHDCSGCFRREQNRRAGFAPAGKAPPFHGARRVEMWRGNRRPWHRCCRPFRLAVPYEPDHSPVSTSPSSNPACRSPAPGSRTRHSCRRPRPVAASARQPLETKGVEQILVGIGESAVAPQLMFLQQPPA